MLFATTGVTPVRINEMLIAIELRIFKVLIIV
jgi:hypothetical protein